MSTTPAYKSVHHEWFTFPRFYGDIAQRLAALNRKLDIVEVGSWRGASALHLVEELLRHGADFKLTIHDTNALPAIRAIEQAFPIMADDRLFWMNGSSWRTADEHEAGSLDFCFLDGDHHFDGVCKDLFAFWPKVRTGGILAGHDYWGGRNHPGVNDAVEGWARGKGLQLQSDDTQGVWWVSKI